MDRATAVILCLLLAGLLAVRPSCSSHPPADQGEGGSTRECPESQNSSGHHGKKSHSKNSSHHGSSGHTPSSYGDSKVVKEILTAHNKFRKIEKVPNLNWNVTLEKYAQDYAEKRKGDCKLEHSQGPYGENIMYGPAGGEWTWTGSVTGWADEKKNYDYNSNSCAPGTMCGHYTQVVWKNTTDVGCGRVTCVNGDSFMVCSYYPPGNYIGEKPF